MSESARRELAALTDHYLRQYCEFYPEVAVWLGFHEYDGRLPDLSRPALTARTSTLHGFLADLERFDPADLDDLAWLDYQVVQHAAGFEAFVIEEWRRWERDPLPYLEVLDVTNYVLRNYAPLQVRVPALIAHLKGFPAVLAAMQENLTLASRPVVEVAVRIARGTRSFLETDLPQALGGLRDMPLRAEFEAANREAVEQVEQIAVWLENDLLGQARADFAIGGERLVHMLALGEAVDLPLKRLEEVAEADLVRHKTAYLETVDQIGPAGRDPRQVIAEGKRRHPTPDRLIPEVRKIVDELRRIVIEYGLVSVPYDENCIVSETPAFLRTAFAMMHDTGPFEQVAREAYYYVTPPEPDWPSQKVEEWMSAFAYHILWNTCVHEAWPGHYLHGLHLRKAPSKATKAFGTYSSFEGWAHYCEQMMLEQGAARQTSLGGDGLWVRLGQLNEALLRNVRFVCALGLHTGMMTVEEARQRFIEDAFMEPATAEEEALRGTYDPQYLNYTLGKLMLLKLRDDLQARQGADFDLRAFHDRFLAYGAPPVPLVRALLLGREDKQVL